jgi:hypothetical protein
MHLAFVWSVNRESVTQNHACNAKAFGEAAAFGVVRWHANAGDNSSQQAVTDLHQPPNDLIYH